MELKDQKNTIVSNNHIVVLLTMLLSGWIFFTDIYIYSKLGLILFTVITLLFLNGLGRKIPIMELIVLIMLMQMVVAPIIAYHYLENKLHYPMEVDEQQYMSYVFFCIVLFIVGLLIPLKKQKHTAASIISEVARSDSFNGKFGLSLILVGLISGSIVDIVPVTLRFLAFLFENCKYIGAFYLFFSNNRYRYLWILVVYIKLTYETIGGGLFINLFVWTFLFAIVVSFKYNVNLLFKTGFFIAGIFIAFFIQSFKTEYREVIWEGKGRVYSEQTRTNQEVFVDMATERAEDTESLYERSNYSNFISRLNQGWILAKVLIHVPAYEPFTNGEVFFSDIRASIVPRILDPNKTVAGGKEGEKKFFRFTGKHLVKGTRMTIGILGDAYVNFGLIGGAFFMLGFGLFLNYILGIIYNLSSKYPSLILWIPFIFFYAMRAGNEFVVILNFITKSSIVVFIIFFLNKNRLRQPLVTENS